MKYDKKKAIDIIINAAQNYQNFLQDKTFLIIYQRGKEIVEAEVEFRGNHFLHLTGVKTNLPAQRFYEKCLNRKISITEIELDNKGKVQQKLLVLPFLHELMYHNCMIGNFINNGVYICADYFIGNTKAVLSVGFRNGKKFDFPVTLYKEDVRRLSQPTNKVLAILSKNCQHQEYSKCTYLSKGQDIAKLPITKKCSIVLDALCEEDKQFKESGGDETMCDLVENYAKKKADEKAVQEAKDSALRFFQNGASYDLVRSSITLLSDEELQEIYKKARNNLK